jgi:hypothetical protein
MAGIDEKLGPLESVLLFHSRSDLVRHDARDAHYIRAYDNNPPARPAFKRQRLGPKWRELSLRRVRARGIAGHPDGAGRRDVYAANPGFQARAG